ncbi:unnamed protein product [Lupinus luteus]|uniref:Uncharacterized protein n=1 Tax=Lupinus luteus TaxID=3873 RepID=A0AAV1X018_LUPLU
MDNYRDLEGRGLKELVFKHNNGENVTYVNDEIVAGMKSFFPDIGIFQMNYSPAFRPNAVPIGSLGKWIDTVFKNNEDELKAHKEDRESKSRLQATSYELRSINIHIRIKMGT